MKRTSLTLIPEIRERLQFVCTRAGMRQSRVVGALTLAAARLLTHGFNWFDLVRYMNIPHTAVSGLVRIGQDGIYPPDTAVWLLVTAAAGAVGRGVPFGDVIRAITNLSPTADVPQSVTADVTD